ncbi:hypothetical protein C7E12_22770, partial [Stenotrophomonas maltophilia]
EQVQLDVRGGDDLLNYWLYPSRFSAIAAQGDINVTGSNLWREQVQLDVRGGDDLLNYWLYPSRFSAIAAQGDI